MTEPAHLNEAYDLDATAAWIREGGHARVALQMPDELLHDAVAVAAALARRCNDGGGGVRERDTRVVGGDGENERDGTGERRGDGIGVGDGAGGGSGLTRDFVTLVINLNV